MRGMAVRAFYRTLDDAMIGGKVKLGLHIRMTRKTEIRFPALEKFWGHLDLMDLMAVITPYGTQLVNPSVELGEFLVLGVTRETGIGPAFCILVFEREDKSFSLGLRMFFSRAVARFTPLLRFGNFRINNPLPVRSVFLEALIEVFMAILAGLGSDISPFLLFCLVLAEGNKAEKEEDNGRGNHPYH